MRQDEFRAWLAQADRLTEAQREEAARSISEGAESARSKAAVERAVGESRTCPRCGAGGAVRNGMARGLQRYRCKTCRRTFNAVTGTPLGGLHRKDRWLAFGEALAAGETLKQSAARCGISYTTAFRWRHRFLEAARKKPETLRGIVEADETVLLRSFKGQRVSGRRPRKRGGKAELRGRSSEHVPVLFAADRSGATVSRKLESVRSAEIAGALKGAVARDAVLVTDGARFFPPAARELGLAHVALNQSAGRTVVGPCHIQTANSRHSHFKGFLHRFRGVATKYLPNYLEWFALARLDCNASAATCLTAAVNAPSIRKNT